MSLLHVSLMLLLIYANKDAKGASLDIDQLVSTSLVDGKENTLTDIVKLEEKFETEKARLESVVSTLQAEIDANKLGIQNNVKLPDNIESLVISILESKVSTLQAEVDENNAKLADMEHVSNFTVSVVDRLDKMSKLGTSCTELAHQGNLESGYYLLDTDGINDNEPPYNAYCKMPEEQTFVGKKDIIENIPLFNFSNIVKKYDMKTYTQIDKYLPYI